MIRRFSARLVLVLFASALWAQSIAAQDTSISLQQFWNRLAQTDEMLQSSAPPDANQIQALWEGVNQVRLEDGGTVAVDMSWIRDAVADGQANTMDALRKQTHALLEYHRNGGLEPSANSSAAGDGASLNRLDEVLRDPRFQYAEFTPTPVPEMPDTPQVNLPPAADVSGLAQIILLVAGVIVVALVFVYFARSLQVQSAEAEPDVSADPTTSTDAQTRADETAQSQDYRSAIRYMYLASLLMLDERGVIHYDSSLTNREHLRHLRDKPQVYEILRRVINAFEEVWYGYHPIDEAYYQRFRQQVDELHRIVA
jgi:hypothetical protein